MPFIHAGEQLVVELYTRDVRASVAFYEQLGFKVERVEPGFAALRWEDHLFLLDERQDANPPFSAPVGNVRIMVADVDHYWRLAHKFGLTIFNPIEDRAYGLRDFIVTGPDGMGLRFASPT